MKQLFLLGALFSIGFLSACTDATTPTQDASLPDLTTLYAQVCETKDGPCAPMVCSLQSAGGYVCAESVASVGTLCSAQKTMDDVITSYQICGKENADKLSIFSYGQTLETVNSGMTPAQLEQKITEETAVVENGGSSSFLTTMMAAAAGTVIGGLVSNALFGQKNAMPPSRPASAYEQPMNKSSLDQAKTDTKANTAKVQQAVKQSRAKAASSNTKKTNTTNTKPKSNSGSSTKKRR